MYDYIDDKFLKALQGLGRVKYDLAPDNKTYTVSVTDANGCEVGAVESESIEDGIKKLHKKLINGQVAE